MRLLALLLLWGLVAGCSSERVGVQMGFVTEEVKGRITPAAKPRPVVLVRAHRAGFVEGPQGRLAEVNAFLVFPDAKGEYQVPFATEVRAVQLLVFKPGFKPARAGFERSLGVESYRFDLDLKPEANWKEGYYLGLKPVLSGYITEERYKLPARDVLFLNEWMDQVEADLSEAKEP